MSAVHDPNRPPKTALFCQQNQGQLSVQNEPRFTPRFGRPQQKKLAVVNQPGKSGISKEGKKTERQQPHNAPHHPFTPNQPAPDPSPHIHKPRTPHHFFPFPLPPLLLVINQVSTTSAGHHLIIAYPSKNTLSTHINHHNGPH